MGGKAWTKEEIEFLEGNYGTISLEQIAKKLGRSLNAVLNKKDRLKLGAFADASEYLTFNRVVTILYSTGNQSTRDRLIRNGFPAIRKKFVRNSFLIVYPKDLWKWLEKNKHMVTFKNMEPGDFGYPEPKWAKVKRMSDKNSSRGTARKWTKTEEEQLLFLVKQYTFTSREISRRLNRTEPSIYRKLIDLGVKERPVRAVPKLWTNEQIEILLRMKQEGYTYEDISDRLKVKTAKAVKGKLERLAKEGNACAT